MENFENIEIFFSDLSHIRRGRGAPNNCCFKFREKLIAEVGPLFIKVYHYVEAPFPEVRI